MSRFCIYCGAEDTFENPVIENICFKCRIKRGELLNASKKEFRIDMCKSCYSIRLGHKWIETNGFEDALHILANNYLVKHVSGGTGVSDLELLKYEYITTPSWRTIIRLYFKGVYGSKEFVYPVEFTIYLNPVKCSRCIMIDSREYEALVQIRGFNKNILDKIFNKIIESDPKMLSNIIDYYEVKNGVDLYFYSKRSARKLVRMIQKLVNKEYSLIVKESFEEVGTRQGSRRTRLTISIKIT